MYVSNYSQEECVLFQPVNSEPSGKKEWEREELSGGPLEPRRRRRRGACYVWNDGNCSRPYCRYDHVCSKCYGDHRWSSCRSERQEVSTSRKLTRDRKGGPPSKGCHPDTTVAIVLCCVYCFHFLTCLCIISHTCMRVCACVCILC